MKENIIKNLSKFILIFVLVLTSPINTMAASDVDAQKTACSNAYSKYKAQMNSNCSSIVYGNNAVTYIKGVFPEISNYSALTSEQKQQYYNRCVSMDGLWGIKVSDYINPVNNQYSSKTGMTCTASGILKEGVSSSSSSTSNSQNSAVQTATATVMLGSSGTVNQSIESSNNTSSNSGSSGSSSSGGQKTTGQTAADMVKDDDYELNYGGSPCENERVALAVSVVGKVIDIVKIVVPILLVIMALVDITKAVLSQDDSKMQKIMGHLVKRIISAVIIFFIITIVQIVCGLIGDGSVDNDCLEIISSPWNVSTDVWDD